MDAALIGVSTGGRLGIVYVPPGSTAPESKAHRPLSLKTAVMGNRVMGGVGLSQRIAPPVVTVAAAGM